MYVPIYGRRYLDNKQTNKTVQKKKKKKKMHVQLNFIQFTLLE